MKKVLFTIFVFIFLGIPASAQIRSRVFDNFDTSTGIKIVTPTAKTTTAVAPITSSKKDKKEVKKTSQQTMTVQEGVSLKNNVQKISSTQMIMSSTRTMGGFTTGDATVDSYIADSSRRYNIDPLLIYAQMHQESGFKLKATSYKGARGLMQLMPATAIRFGVTDIYNPKQNIEAGVKYMRWLLDKFGGDLRLALAGYNAGEGAVMKYGYQIPPYNETQEYVRRITARYNSISNPTTLSKTVKKVSATQVTQLVQKESAPLTVYERSALAIKLPDGRMRLVNQ